MKTLYFFTTNSKPALGGIAEYLHQLCEHLGARRKVEFCSTLQDSANFYPKNYTMKTLNPRPSRKLGQMPGDSIFVIRKINTLRYYRRLEKMAYREINQLQDKENTVVVIGTWSMISHFWCQTCIQFKVPYIIICYGAELVVDLNGPVARWRKEDLKMARKIVAISRGTGTLIEKVIGGKIDYLVVNPGIDPTQYKKQDFSRVAERRRALGIHEGGKVLLSVGRLIPRKGFDKVMEALSLLGQDMRGVYYVIVGDGPEEMRLREAANRLAVKSQAIFLRGVSDEDKWILYEMCDVFAMPSVTLGGTDWEGFGIVFLEAALAGKPSIGGNNGGAPDAINHGETGFLVDPERPVEIAEKIGFLLQNESKRIEMGERARSRAISQFDWDTLSVLFQKEALANI